MLLHSRLNLGFSLNYFRFYCKFCAFGIILFTLHVFKKFYQRVNKPNIHNNIIGSISSFQNGLNDLFRSTAFNFNSNVIEGSHKGKNNTSFNFSELFFKMYIFEVVKFFLV